MSIFRIESEPSLGIEGLAYKLAYIIRPGASSLKTIYTVNVSFDAVFEEMVRVKEIHSQLRGKCYIHYEFRINEKLDEGIGLDDIYRMGVAVAKYVAHYNEHFYQAVMSVHNEPGIPLHFHIIANNIDMVTGKRFSPDLCDIFAMRRAIDRIAQENGISIIQQKGKWQR